MRQYSMAGFQLSALLEAGLGGITLSLERKRTGYFPGGKENPSVITVELQMNLPAPERRNLL